MSGSTTAGKSTATAGAKHEFEIRKAETRLGWNKTGHSDQMSASHKRGDWETHVRASSDKHQIPVTERPLTTDWMPMMQEPIAVQNHVCSAPTVVAQTSGQSYSRLRLTCSLRKV